MERRFFRGVLTQPINAESLHFHLFYKGKWLKVPKGHWQWSQKVTGKVPKGHWQWSQKVTGSEFVGTEWSTNVPRSLPIYISLNPLPCGIVLENQKLLVMFSMLMHIWNGTLPKPASWSKIEIYGNGNPYVNVNPNDMFWTLRNTVFWHLYNLWKANGTVPTCFDPRGLTSWKKWLITCVHIINIFIYI